MSPVGNTPLQKNAMNHHGVGEVFFCTFPSKKATSRNYRNDYTQSISENFNRFSFTGKERDEETGYGYFGARYMDHELTTMWLSVDPMSDKYPNLSPYAYCAWNPVKLVDPDGKEMTDFKDKSGNLIMHVDDGSNAVFRLTGTNQTNEYFVFNGFSDQGGKNEISITGLIAGAQEYALDNYSYCNQAVNFVGRTYVNAYDAANVDVNSGDVVSGNLCATPIMSELSKIQTPYFEKTEANISQVQKESANGAFVVGVTKGHVCMVSTKDYEITKYSNGKSSTYNYKGGLTINVNGSTTNGRGPRKNNSSYNLKYAHADGWYSLKPLIINLKPVNITLE